MKQDKIPLNGVLEIEPFNCWGIDSMVPFPPCNSHVYILVYMDYIIKWVETISYVANDAQTFSNFKKIMFLLDSKSIES